MKNILMFMIFFSSFLALHAQSNLIIIDGDEVKVTKVLGFNNFLFFYKDENGSKAKLKPNEYETLEFQKGDKIHKYKTFRKEDIPGPFINQYIPLEVLSEGVYNLYVLLAEFQISQKSSNTLYYSSAEDSNLKYLDKHVMKEVATGNVKVFRQIANPIKEYKRMFDDYNIKHANENLEVE